MMRESGWGFLFDQVSWFCEKHNIDIPNMDDTFLTRGQPRCKAHEIKFFYYCQVELFYAIIDVQLQELNSCFIKVNIELILCVVCLNPSDSFVAFDKQKLIHLVQLYS